MIFHCSKCEKNTVRRVSSLKPGERVLCKHCGNELYKRGAFMKPLEINEYQSHDLTGQPIEYMTCDRCGKRFNKRLALYAEGVIFCPECYEKYELLVDEPKPQPMPETQPRKYSTM